MKSNRLWALVLPVSLVAGFAQPPWHEFGISPNWRLSANEQAPAHNYERRPQGAVDLELRLGPPSTNQRNDMIEICSSQSSCTDPEVQRNQFTQAHENDLLASQSHNNHGANESTRKYSSVQLAEPTAPSLAVATRQFPNKFQPTDPYITWWNLNRGNNLIVESTPLNGFFPSLPSHGWPKIPGETKSSRKFDHLSLDVPHDIKGKRIRFEPNQSNSENWMDSPHTSIVDPPVNYRGSHTIPTPRSKLGTNMNHQSNPTRKKTIDQNLSNRNQKLNSDIKKLDVPSTSRGNFLEERMNYAHHLSLVQSPISTAKSQALTSELLVLPWIKVVNFEPVSIDGELILEAINRIKDVRGRKYMHLFVKESENRNKIICTKPNAISVSDFLSVYKHFCHVDQSEQSVFIGRQSPKILKLNACWKFFVEPESQSPADASIRPKIENYKSFVMRDIQGGEFLDLQTKIRANFSGHKYLLRTKLNHLTKLVSSTLPVYFFYIDMITTIIPREDLNNGALLETERKIAAKSFFEVIEAMLLDGSKDEIQLSAHKIKDRLLKKAADSFKPPFYISKGGNPFLWKVLHYWIWNSRGEIVELANLQEPSNHLKSFFNSFFMALLD